MVHGIEYVANCSTLFRELPILERPAAAVAAGFASIEFWWPFPAPEPDRRDVDEFVAAVRDSGARLTGLNFYGGDLAGADCGVVSLPDRVGELRSSLPTMDRIVGALGVTMFNALYGNRLPDPERHREQDALAIETLVDLASWAGRFDGTVLIEPISGPKPYPLRTAADAIAVVDAVRDRGAGNAAMLFDVYHLASNGDDLAAAARTYGAQVGHVQIADVPGRGEPGSGELDVFGPIGLLRETGYRGRVALEYLPTTTTEASLGWLISRT